MSKTEMPEWVGFARKFMATGREEFLRRAVQVCPDTSVRELLERPEAAEGTLAPDDWRAVSERLKGEGRAGEAAVVELIGLRSVALAAQSPERLDEEQRQVVAGVCNYAEVLSREHDFGECEALFAGARGTGAATLHRWEEARGLLGHALVISRELAKREPHIYGPNVAMTLNNLGNVLCQERDFSGARAAFEEGVGIYRELAKTEPHIYGPDVAMTLDNLGNVLSDERDFSGARAAFEEALSIRRELAKTEPHIYRPYVAGTLNNLGNVLREERDFSGARAAFEEGVGIYRELAKREPRIYRPDVAMTLNNLGNVLGQERDFSGARATFEEGVGIYRELAKREPHIYGPDVAMTLNNLGNVLCQERDFSGARAAFEEGVGIYRELAKTEPHIYGPYVATTLNNLGNVLEEVGEGDAAVDVSRQAVEAAEGCEAEPEKLWLAKGSASGAYQRWLGYVVGKGEGDRAFRCLAAMREGPVCALGKRREESVEEAAKALGEVGERVGGLRIVVAQGLTGAGMVLAVLDAGDSEPLRCYDAEGFGGAGERLFQEIIRVFDEEDERGGEVRREVVGKLGAEAWGLLPERIREVLDPAAGGEVLISGDWYWTAFPWEGLRCGDGHGDWLGLRRTLARWGPLTGGAIGRLGRRVFGEGRRTAGIVCPWDAVREKPLPWARAEAENLGRDLVDKQGYRLVPEQKVLMGLDANAEGMAEVLEDTGSVIHYTGHGSIIGNEEVLVLHGGDEEHPCRYFGRKDLEILKGRPGRGKLLGHRPLVVLNSCRTGRTRAFGGQREDLAWAFLEEGAEAVIASALPVGDFMGQILGESLYAPWFLSAEGMGRTLVAVRRLLEGTTRDSRLWPAWTLLSYHGNPYARMPHAGDGEDGYSGSSWSDFGRRLAGWLGLRDASEAAELVREIRG